MQKSGLQVCVQQAGTKVSTRNPVHRSSKVPRFTRLPAHRFRLQQAPRFHRYPAHVLQQVPDAAGVKALQVSSAQVAQVAEGAKV